MEDFLITIVPGLLIAVTTSFITVRLSISQFYSQKWWERKWDEYREMVDALHDLRNHSYREHIAMDDGRKLVEERRQALTEHAREGYEQLTRAISVGAFVFSKASMDVLDQLQEALAQISASDLAPQAFLDAIVTAFDKAISDFIPIARKDLAAK